MEPAISFFDVNKQFKLDDHASSVLDTIVSVFSRKPVVKEHRRELHAIRDMNFEIESGQCIGLVGRNGSGKSTLLKLAAGIIRPTSGRIEVRGRLSALLELGAGFHPDLTGQENIWLNASILGLSNADIARVFDDIVEFSELGDFINMAVKHYSSGMFMRLGFSVAVHVNPDIILIDEILAVGDQSFQNKCIERLHELNAQGVTVMFVSHSLETVRSLCTRIFWVENGAIFADGPTEQTVADYLASHTRLAEKKAAEVEATYRRWGSGEVTLTGLQLLDKNDSPSQHFMVNQPMTIEFRYRAQPSVKKAEFGVAFYREDGTLVGAPEKQIAETKPTAVKAEGRVQCKIDSLPLTPGAYHLTATVYDPEGERAYDHIEQVSVFQVFDVPVVDGISLIDFPATWVADPEDPVPEIVESVSESGLTDTSTVKTTETQESPLEKAN